MATYTAITDAEIDQDSPITQTLMTKYRDNLIATTEGAAGAPRIVRGALDTATSSASGSIGSGAVVSITLSAYSFFPEFNAPTNVYLVGSTTSGGADAPKIGLRNGDPDNTQSYAVYWRYIDT